MRTWAIRTGWRRTALVAALAYVLALQGVLLALGGAMQVQAAGLPATLLCVQKDDGGTAHQPGSAEHALSCALACSVSSAPDGPLPVIASLPMSRAVPVTAGFKAGRQRLAASSAVLPVGSRAPPRLG